MDELVIGFAGLTHLGVNSLAAAAERGFYVLGFDENPETVDAMSNEQLDINEDGLIDLLKKNKDKISFSSDPTDLRNCDIIYISIDVPTDANANSNLDPIESIIHIVLGTVKEETLIVVLCQVPPGFTRQVQQRHINTYYQVETLIFGRAVERATHPERFIIGCADPSTVDSRLLHHLEAYDCPILPMRFESAELCKTAINLFLAASVSTANTLADICERIGADWSEIIPSLRLDRRIGNHAYIETGLGLSGGNIERDLKTVQSLGKKSGADTRVVETFMSHSTYRKNWLVEQFENYTSDLSSPKIGVLGLSYKENTHSIKNSPSVAFLEKVLKNGVHRTNLKVYDPVVTSLPEAIDVIVCHNAYQAAENVDMLFINTAWNEFRSLDVTRLVKTIRNGVVVDPFNLLDQKLPKHIKHVKLGKTW